MSDELEDLRLRVAQLEGRTVPPSAPAGWGKFIAWIALGLFAVFVFLTILGAMLPDRTYRDVANEETRRCMQSGGDGRWYPGMGSLTQYCELAGATKAIHEKALADAQ